MGTQIITEAQVNAMVSVLDKCYDLALCSSSKLDRLNCQKVAEQYLRKYKTPSKAIHKMLRNQTTLTFLTGFATNIGGISTAVLTIPANITSSLCIQLRTIAILSIMLGLDPEDEEVKTFAYLCVAGMSVNEVSKQFGIKLTERLATTAIQKVPYEVILKINKAVSFRMITKWGTKGLINLGKCIPIVGGIAGGAVDVASLRAVTKLALNNFKDLNDNK